MTNSRNLLIVLLLIGCAIVAFLFLINSNSGSSASELVEARVAALVDEMTKNQPGREKASAELESMGEEAVPYIVSHIGDMRPLAIPHIILVNKSNDAPEVVHDALSTILKHMTGKSFGHSSPKDQQEDIDQWIAWCRSRYTKNVAACGNDIW